ncbi:MAG: class I SAM-dependent methyltransferase [Nitrospirales bacterium]|nr:class I SAM-dependent methyltransferase [Nitrospira sp.]MDR4502106.1 class I SAM-dependent methyltransferase [Nitrospirales bacterium]
MTHNDSGEIQYREAIQLMKARPERLGLMSGWSWHDDPKRLVFFLARYKFVAKMLDGCERVLEVGCGDGFGTRIVTQTVKHVTGVDFDPEFVNSAKTIMSERWPATYLVHNMLEGPVPGTFDGAYSLDVLEHISKQDESRFIENMVAPLTPHGVMLIGTPSSQSQAYASEHSRIGHVNCKDQKELKVVMQRWFHNVFMFSMNDEVVHTGFHPMSHYNFCVCCGKK